jgi:diacylglycerol O-acyltransferase 1
MSSWSESLRTTSLVRCALPYVIEIALLTLGLGVAFAGMMLQLPLIAITDPLQKIRGHGAKVTGNVIFWVSFCLIGQPLAALLYFFAWQAKYGSVSKLQATSKA